MLNFKIEARAINGERFLRLGDIANEMKVGPHRNWGKDLARLSSKVGHPVYVKELALVSNGKGTFLRPVIFVNKEGFYHIVQGKDLLGAQIGYWAAKEVFR